MIRKRRDRWHGFLRGLKRFRVDHFSDHPLHNYIDPILEAVQKEQDAMGRGESAVDASDLTGQDPKTEAS